MSGVETELKTLEAKLGQFVELCQRLRADNQQLRQDLAAAVTESRRLEEKISAATTRIESLLSHFPAVEEES